MSTKQIASSTLWQVASQAAMAALSILTIKFVALGLSRELAGNYHSAYGYLQIFGILADFGLYAVAVREVSRAHNKAEVMGSLIILRTIILLISLGTALLIVWIMPMWRGTPLPLGVTVASLVPFFTLLSGIQRTVFQVTYRMKYVFIAEVAQRILTVCLIGGIIYTGVRDTYDLWVYHAFLGAGGLGALLLFLFSTFYAQRLMPVRLQWDTAEMKRLFALAAPYGAAFLCMALYRQTDITFIAALRDDFETQNAFYGFALRATEVAYLFPTFLLNSTLPILSERDAKGEDTRIFVGKIFFAVMLLGVTAALFSVLWARPVMSLLTTEDYLSTATTPGSDTALMLLAAPMLLNAVVLFAFYSMLTRNAWQPLVATLAFGALFSFGLNLMLIPRFGFTGACMASIGTHLFLAVLLLPQSLKFLPMSLDGTIIRSFSAYVLLLGGMLLLTAPLLGSNLITVIGLILALLWAGGVAHLTGITRLLRVH